MARRRVRALVTVCGLSVAVAACAPGSDRPDDSAPGTPVLGVLPPGTDVWLADLSRSSDGTLTLGEPVNVTRRAGYDNQPMFVPDGSGFWYTAIDEHTGQADIWRYDLGPARVAQVVSSNPESEYSATPLPDGTGISVIRVEADSTQRLWRFDLDGSNGAPVIEDLAPIGYHAWADDHTVVVFVLGEPATLRRVDTETGGVEVIASDVGRSIQTIPGSADVSFVQRHDDGSSTIMRLPAGASEPVPIVAAVDGGDFHAWTPDGLLLMASGSILYGTRPDGGAAWSAIADLSRLRLQITRLAVRPDGSQIALVGEVDLQG